MDEIGLKTTNRKRGAGVIVELDGDLDIYSAPQFRGELGKALADHGDTALFIDLRNLRFIDSAGLAVLLWAQSARRESRHAMQVLIEPGSQAERVFRLSGLESTLAIVDDPRRLSGP